MLGFVYHTHIQQNGGLFYTVLLVRAANHCYSQKINCMGFGICNAIPHGSCRILFLDFLCTISGQTGFFSRTKDMVTLCNDISSANRFSSACKDIFFPGSSFCTRGVSCYEFTFTGLINCLSCTQLFIVFLTVSHNAMKLLDAFTDDLFFSKSL